MIYLILKKKLFYRWCTHFWPDLSFDANWWLGNCKDWIGSDLGGFGFKPGPVSISSSLNFPKIWLGFNFSGPLCSRKVKWFVESEIVKWKCLEPT